MDGSEQQQLRERLGLRGLVGESPAFLAEARKLPAVAGCDAGVLILGETGTGKELFARALHYLGRRSGEAFVPVNCGAIPVELVENELFGHDRAAFTGATTAAGGLIAEAEGGTLFLDEVDSLPPAAQVKLLRFLEEKRYRRLGSSRLREADLRVVAATNAELETGVAAGRFRRDLYYRLNVVQLRLPPLRERRSDIPLLARHFLDRFSQRLDKPLSGFSPEAMQTLVTHPWPGNVRELENVVQRAVILAGSGRRRIEPGDIGLESAESRASSRRESFQEAKRRVVAAFERDYLRSLLASCGGNVSRAARTARKDRRSLWGLIKKHRIDVDRYRSSPG